MKSIFTGIQVQNPIRGNLNALSVNVPAGKALVKSTSTKFANPLLALVSVFDAAKTAQLLAEEAEERALKPWNRNLPKDDR